MGQGKLESENGDEVQTDGCEGIGRDWSDAGRVSANHPITGPYVVMTDLEASDVFLSRAWVVFP